MKREERSKQFESAPLKEGGRRERETVLGWGERERHSLPHPPSNPRASGCGSPPPSHRPPIRALGAGRRSPETGSKRRGAGTSAPAPPAIAPSAEKRLVAASTGWAARGGGAWRRQRADSPSGLNSALQQCRRGRARLDALSLETQRGTCPPWPRRRRAAIGGGGGRSGKGGRASFFGRRLGQVS